MMKKKDRKHEGGFTLIEIIAVLIVLGVLAAIAIPKFMNLTADAQKKAALQAVAEGQARLSMAAAKLILSTGTAPADATRITAIAAQDSGTDAGDYTLAFSGQAGTRVTITATGKTGTAAGTATATGSWAIPR